jgi:predicted nuclease of predicted toxin-antitoxin system
VIKVLLDSCVASTVYHTLALSGIDVEWTGNWDSDPGDESILAYAHTHVQILVTLDKDFGALAIREGKPHYGILRLVGLSTREQPIVCQQVLEKHHVLLAQGAIITADGKRVRIRQPS